MLRADEIAEEYDAQDQLVFTPNGWKPILKVYKTIPLLVWELHTESYKLLCSALHLVVKDGVCVEVQTLNVGDKITTLSGEQTVTSVLNTGIKDELYDLTVDDPSGLFYSDGIVSHNSTTFVARQLINSFLIPGYKSLYVCPLHEQQKTYADRYFEMEGSFRGNTGKQNLYSKLYSNNSRIDMLHCLETGNAARGKSVSECLFDETLGLNADIIPEILQTLSLSKMPMTIYAGTALSVDTLLETQWQRSSLGMWYVRAMDGHHWINMYDQHELMRVCDNPLGPTCPYTGKLLRVTDGCFVHQNKRALAAGDIGIHVPLCIIPDNLESVNWGKIYKYLKLNDPKKTCQECFGIATSEGAREISQKELEEICVLTDSTLETLDKIKKGYYSLIVSGCDWGGSDYNPATKTKTSYTVHVILGLAPDGNVDILHMQKYSGMNYREITSFILADHQKYNARVMATDFGVGMAYNMLVRDLIPWLKHFIMLFTGPGTSPMAPIKNSELANHFGLNKTEAVTNVFAAVKDKKIRAKNWELTSNYLLDYMNVFRAPSDTPSGATTFKWIRNPLKADDTLMATAFCYVLIKIFTGSKIVEDPSLKALIMAVLQGGSMFDIYNYDPPVISG